MYINYIFNLDVDVMVDEDFESYGTDIPIEKWTDYR